jgi:hypothetical protein
MEQAGEVDYLITWRDNEFVGRVSLTPCRRAGANRRCFAFPKDQGVGGTPPDLDEDLRRFVDAVTDAGGRERDGGWLSGLREYVPDAGPVPSNRFL